MRIIDLKYPKNYDIVLFGDNHYGNRLSCEKGFQKCIDFIAKKPSRHAIHMGDAIEAITWDDARFDLSVHKLVPQAERDDIVEILKPIRNRLDVMLLGNHELKLWKYGNITSDICRALSTPKHTVEYGTLSCVIRIFDDEGLQFKMYLHHGFGYARSAAKDYHQALGNLKASLKNKLKDFFADVLIAAMGHTHKLLIVPPTDEQLFLYTTEKGEVKGGYMDLAENSKHIDPDRRYYINTGSFLRLFDEKPDARGEYATGYAELRGYKPVKLGFVNIEVRNRRPVNVYGVKV